MSAPPTAATRLIALLGDPISHSLSPRFQNEAFRAAGVDGVYVALRCAAPEVPGLLRGIALAGGGGNVTIPHKELAARVVDRGTSAVARTGACNTYWPEGGQVVGDNTDVSGVSAAVRSLLGTSPAGARVLLLGAGGAARATLAALLDDGAAEIVVFNRTEERARALRDSGTGSATRVILATDAEALAGEPFDLAVNATSLGLHAGDPLPLPIEQGPRLAAALDLVYSPGSTSWVRALCAEGVPAADGLEMLLHQGAAAFERWWGIPAPLAVMRTALSHLPETP